MDEAFAIHSLVKVLTNILELAEGDKVLEEKICSSVIQKKRKACDEAEISLKNKQGRNLKMRVNQKKEEHVFIQHP